MINDIIRLGLTHTDRPGYVPSMDGWKPGALQTEITLGPVDLPGQHDTQPITVAEAVVIAETCWHATNRPAEIPARSQLERDIDNAWAVAVVDLQTSKDPRLHELRALSIGDTVSVRGVTLAATGSGWEPVEPTPQ